MVLINAIKDVAKALGDLIGATKGAAGKPADDPSMYQLKSAAKVMSVKITYRTGTDTKDGSINVMFYFFPLFRSW